jgi:antibiotic biosynthesis monooxygenase (ABM) superfamily enzyme
MVFCLEQYFKLQNEQKNYGTGLTPPLLSQLDTLGFVVLNTILTITLLTFVIVNGKVDNLILSNWLN